MDNRTILDWQNDRSKYFLNSQSNFDIELSVKHLHRIFGQKHTVNCLSKATQNYWTACVNAYILEMKFITKTKKRERKKSIFVFVHITENFSMQCISIFEKEWWKKKKNLVVLVPNSNTQKFACSVYLKKEHGKGWKAFMVIVHIPEQLCLQ